MHLSTWAPYGFTFLGVSLCVLVAKSCAHFPVTTPEHHAIQLNTSTIQGAFPLPPIDPKTGMLLDIAVEPPPKTLSIQNNLRSACQCLNTLLKTKHLPTNNQIKIDADFEELLLTFRQHTANHDDYGAQCALKQLLTDAPNASTSMVGALRNDLEQIKE